MPSQTAGTCVSDKGLPTKLTELERVDPQSCLESAERFSEIANRSVNIGLRLQRRGTSDVYDRDRQIERTLHTHFIA